MYDAKGPDPHESEDWQPEEYYGENDDDGDDDASDDDANEYEEDSGSAEDAEIEWDGKYKP